MPLFRNNNNTILSYESNQQVRLTTKNLFINDAQYLLSSSKNLKSIYNIQKRTMLSTRAIISSVTSKPLQSKNILYIYRKMSVIPSEGEDLFKNIKQTQYYALKYQQETKILVLRFFNKLKKVAEKQEIDDVAFVKIIDELITQDPSLNSRSLHELLELAFSKRKVDSSIVDEFYKEYFKIVDQFKVNKGLCDHSTIINAAQGKLLVQQMGIPKENVAIQATPIYSNKENMPITFFMDRMETKKATGNSVCDIIVYNKEYDFKFEKKISYSKNIIYFYKLADLEHFGKRFFYQLERNLKESSKDPKYTLEDIAFLKKMHIILQKANVSNEPIISRVNTVNNFLKNPELPKKFNYPLIIYETRSSINPEIEPISEEVLSGISIPVGPTQFRSAATYAIRQLLDKQPKNTKNAIDNLTKGAFGGSNDTVD